MKGRQRIRQKNKEGKWERWSKWRTNLFVDDGIELAEDMLFGLKSWWNPLDQSEYVGGDSGWDTVRYVQPGISMFNNASPERATGLDGIQVGSEWDYPVDDTWLVSPEDSFISRAIGSRVVLNATRRDQTVEFSVTFNVPGDVPSGTPIRELGIFLANTGPIKDPSNSDSQKPNTMLCRSTISNTGYYNSAGATGNQGDPGFKLCHVDEPLTVTTDIEIQWEFGEL